MTEHLKVKHVLGALDPDTRQGRVGRNIERDEQGMTVLVVDAPDGIDATHTQNPPARHRHGCTSHLRLGRLVGRC